MPKIISVITEDKIKQLSNAQSFERGRRYYKSGAVLEPTRQENELRGYCEGSDYQPYRVTATVKEGEIVSTGCTCPYDWGGICKHRVALLLTWLHQPDSFHTILPLDDTLADRSKDELIALIKQMIKREPDLARLLELPLTPDRQSPLNLDAYRRQIDYAIRQQDYDDYPYTKATAAELDALADTAEAFSQAGDWNRAGTIYALILEEVVSQYEDLHDEDGDVAIVLQRCAENLDDCFANGEPDEETRKNWLSALLEANLKDIEMGGIDMAYPAEDIVLDRATDEEWAWIEDRVEQKIAAKTDRYSSWTREALVGFLAERLERQDKTEAVDALIMSQGTPRQQAFLLIEREQFEQAVEIAREYFADLPGLVTQFADQMVSAGGGDQAEAYIQSELKRSVRTSHLLEWLANHARRRGDLAAALEYWRQFMSQSPRLSSYQTIREIAQELDRWADVRPELLANLETNNAGSTLLEIALDENEIKRAIDLLAKLKGWHSANYSLRVAKAAETDYPDAAISIYTDRAERLIAQRGRGNYHEAAQLLTRVREVYQQKNEAETWQEYISHLRRENSNLPALRDELNKAGL